MMSMAEGTPRRVTSHRLLATAVGNGLAGYDGLLPLQAARPGYAGALTTTLGAQMVDELEMGYTPQPTRQSSITLSQGDGPTQFRYFQFVTSGKCVCATRPTCSHSETPWR